MFGAAKLIRLVPDQPGKGGMKTAVHSHQAGALLDTYLCFNCYVYLGRWRKNRDPQTLGTGQSSILTTQSAHVLYAYSTSDPTAEPTTQAFLHNLAAASVNTIWNVTTGAAVHAITGASSPAVYANIKGKCYSCWGSERAFVMDGVSANTYYVGLAAPAAALTYTLGGQNAYTVFALNGRYIVMHSQIGAAPVWSTADEQKTIVINGASYKTAPGSGGATPGVGFHHYVAYAPGTPGLATNAAGSNIVSISVAWPADQLLAGLALTVGAETALVASYSVAGSVTTVTLQTPLTSLHAAVAYVLNGYQLQLLSDSIVSGWSIAATIMRGSLSWTGPGPRYAYAYVDNATGHLSNLSPILSITEEDQSATPVLTNFVAPSSPDSTRLAVPNIRLFRALLSGGVVLYQLTGGPGQPVDITSPATFTDTYQDAILNTSIVGPRLTNNKPTYDGVHDAYPVHMAYWDGRLWLNPLQASSFVLFSGDSVQIPVGVPEECFPQGNTLTIPAADGRVTGMRVIGSYLVITTERWAYYVAGFNETNYRLLRFSTTMYGVGDYQMDEMPTDSGDGASVVYLGKDNKVYALEAGGGAISLSDPIEDQILADVVTPANYKACRVHVAHIEDRRLVCLATPSHTFLYDMSRKVWSETQGGPTAFGTQYGGSTAVLEFFGRTGGAKYWLTSSISTTFTSAYIQTFSTSFADRKAKRKLNFVRLYVSRDYSPSVPWLVDITTDDTFTTTYTLSCLPYDSATYPGTSGPPAQPDQLYTLYPAAAVPIDGANCKELIGFPYNTTGDSSDGAVPLNVTPLEGFRFSLRIYFPANTAATDLLAADICVSDIQDSVDVKL